MMMPGRNTEVRWSRMGYNGQAKDDEVYGKGNLMSALFWEMDTRILKRWNVDPKGNSSESFYSVFGGNPVINSDLLGDQWKDEKKDGEVAERLKLGMNKQQKVWTKEAEKNNKAADKQQAKGNTTKADELRAVANRASAAADDLEKGQKEIDAMHESSTVFTYKAQNTSGVSYTYMDDNGVVVMQYSNDANAVHESTHGYQHLTGEVQLISGSGGGNNIDAHDEAKAYKRQYYFDPMSVIKLNTSQHQDIKNSDDVTPNLILKLQRPDNGGLLYKNLPIGPLPPKP